MQDDKFSSGSKEESVDSEVCTDRPDEAIIRGDAITHSMSLKAMEFPFSRGDPHFEHEKPRLMEFGDLADPPDKFSSRISGARVISLFGFSLFSIFPFQEDSVKWSKPANMVRSTLRIIV
jgi:hypothetical protein